MCALTSQKDRDQMNYESTKKGTKTNVQNRTFGLRGCNFSSTQLYNNFKLVTDLF